MVLGKLDLHMQKPENEPYLTSYAKINSKWIKDFNYKSWNYKTTRMKQGKS